MQTDNHRNRQRLTKSDDRMLAGICGGIAAFLGWRSRAVRVFWCVATFLTGIVPGVVTYLLFAIAMPPAPRPFNLDDFRVQ